MFKEVVIVEGYHDMDRLIKIYKDIDVIVTNGSEIKESLPVIKEISKKRDIILFLDPDYPGERIRKIIANEIPKAKHAFVKRNLAYSHNRKKIGVEHASDEEIKRALESVLSPTQTKINICNSDLVNLGYIGQKNSQALRDELSEKLGIGHVNGKTLLKRLILFGFDLEYIKNIVKR